MRAVWTRSASSPRRSSTSWFASWRRPRYSFTTPETASSCPSLYMRGEPRLVEEREIEVARSRRTSVTVTIVWWRRVCRLATLRTDAMTVAYCADLQLPDRRDPRAVDVAARVVMEEVADGSIPNAGSRTSCASAALRTASPPRRVASAAIDLDDRGARASSVTGRSSSGTVLPWRMRSPPRTLVHVLAVLALLVGRCDVRRLGDRRRDRRRRAPGANAADGAAAADRRWPPARRSTSNSYQQLLTQLHGTPVVVNIWASWCGPCKAEAPLLRDARRRYGDRVQFLGVDILDSRDGARGFIADYGLDLPERLRSRGRDPRLARDDRTAGHVFYDADGTWCRRGTASSPRRRSTSLQRSSRR